MGASSKAPAPRRRLLLLLAGTLLATLGVVGLLLSRPRSTVVEIEALLSAVELDVMPPGFARRGASGPGALQSFELLAPGFRAVRLDLSGAEAVEAFFSEAGPTEIRPGADGTVRVSSGEPFPAALRVFGTTPLAVETAGRDRRGGFGVRLLLPGHGGEGPGWTASATPAGDLAVDWRGADAPSAGPRTLPASAPDLEAAGGARSAVLGITLPPLAPAATRLRLIDPESGTVLEKRLAFPSASDRFLAWGSRLALLEPVAAEGGPRPLLRSDLPVVRPRFFRGDRLEPESFLLGGTIRFPGGERPSLPLPPRFLLAVASREALTLRSLALEDGRLSLVLWGRLTHLSLGATPELAAEELPPLFLWIYTHKLRALVYSTVVSVLGLLMGAIKLFGLFETKKEDS